MEINYNEYYEEKKKNLTYEIYNIEGVQYNFKLEDMKQLLEIKEEDIFKKYVYYIDMYRINNFYIENFEDSIIKFLDEIKEEKHKDKIKLLKIFLKHEKLFCNEKGIKRLELVPKEYEKRKFQRLFV